MNIRTVLRASAPQDIAHQSAYLYGTEQTLLPPKSPPQIEQVALEGRGRLDTLYQYRQVEGWLGDVPISFTHLIATRSYEYTKQVFTKTNWNTANSNTNSWLV